MAKYTIIACTVLFREISYLAAMSKHVIDVIWMPQNMHNTPSLLRERLQTEISEITDCDAILLGYGLCSNSVIGLEATDIPIVVPKTDDCIALFLGSQKRYLELFHALHGVYWYNAGWIDRTAMPSKRNYEKTFLQYVERYGEDNAEFLMEQELGWAEKYQTCAFIESCIYGAAEYEDFSRRCAEEMGWAFMKFRGDTRMVKALVDGNFDSGEFLVCPPGHRIVERFDGNKMDCERIR